MSEKRFEMKGDTHIFDSQTSEEYYAPSEYELVDLLNSLQEENEQLKQELNNFKPVMFQDIRKGTVILYSKEG